MRNNKKHAANLINHQFNPGVDLDKIFSRRARYTSDYTCSFCFKTFSSAQSYGGHLTAHRAERNEEKRLHVKHPISYRRQLFLQSLYPSDLRGVAVPPQTQPQRHNKAPSKALEVGHCRNSHGNQHNLKSSSSLDLNLPAIGSDYEADVKEYSLGMTYDDEVKGNAAKDSTSNKDHDREDIVKAESLDLSLKL